jgi:hypothetical protein
MASSLSPARDSHRDLCSIAPIADRTALGVALAAPGGDLLNPSGERLRGRMVARKKARRSQRRARARASTDLVIPLTTATSG